MPLSANGYQYFLICEPCADVRHEECVGAEEFCMCFVELMWEAEDRDEGRDQ